MNFSKTCVDIFPSEVFVHHASGSGAAKLKTVVWTAKFKKNGPGYFYARIAKKTAPQFCGDYHERLAQEESLEKAFVGSIFNIWDYNGKLYCQPKQKA